MGESSPSVLSQSAQGSQMVELTTSAGCPELTVRQVDGICALAQLLLEVVLSERRNEVRTQRPLYDMGLVGFKPCDQHVWTLVDYRVRKYFSCLSIRV